MPKGEPIIGRVSPAQIQQLMQLHLDLAASVGPPALLLDRFARRVRHILGAEILIAARRDDGWLLCASSAPVAPTLDADAYQRFDQVVGQAGRLRSALWEADDRVWTAAGAGSASPVVLAIEGDWTRSLGALSLLIGDLSLLWRQADATAARRRAAVHRLTRAMAAASKIDALAPIIIRGMARAVDARIGALAVPSENGADLSIVATYGYRRELVEHLRIRPGVGIMGSVFQSGKLLLVKSGERFAHPGRARYQTKSFVIVPIRLGPRTLAVASVTDRRDGQSFTKQDALTLRALAAPAALAIARAIASAQADKFAQTAAIDPGSGVFNRRYLQTRIDEELQRARRHGAPVSLVMLDLDNFKSINDSFGHLAGDAVIRDVAQILRRAVRIFDVCARFGGEEFAILMPGASLDSATKIATRIRERIEAYRPADPKLSRLRVTASLGLAVSFPDVAAQDLIARADEALYLAKREGKNRLRVLGPDSNARQAERGSSGI